MKTVPKKSPELKAEEEHRYRVASGAANKEELELFLTDLNQAIRITAIINLDVNAENLLTDTRSKVGKLFKSLSEMSSD